MYLRALIVCVSKYYGNTLKVANVMASVLDAQVFEPRKVRSEVVSEYDLVGFGSGIYFGKPDSSIFELIDQIEPVNSKEAFIFSTRGRNSLFENKYHRDLKEKLSQKGFNVIGQFSCRGYSNYHSLFKLCGGVNKGYPRSKDLDNAKKFIQKMNSAKMHL